MREKQCLTCGRIFSAWGGQKYCRPQCREEYYRASKDGRIGMEEKECRGCGCYFWAYQHQRPYCPECKEQRRREKDW